MKRVPKHIYDKQDYALVRAQKEWGPLAFAVLQPYDRVERLCFVGVPNGPRGYGPGWNEAFEAAAR